MVEAVSNQPDVVTEFFREINDPPLFKRVNTKKINHVRNKKLIHQENKSEILELHEQPIVRNVYHTPIITVIKEEPIEVIVNESEEYKAPTGIALLKSIDLSGVMDRSVEIRMEEEKIIEDIPVLKEVSRVTTKEVHHRKIITEIRKTPIIEIHEQQIQRIVYEKPITRTVKHETIFLEEEQAVKETEISSGEDAGAELTSIEETKEQSRTTIIGNSKNLVLSLYDLLVPKLVQYIVMYLFFFTSRAKQE